LGIESGVDLVRQNFPDKNWLILAISTVSDGKDEIFEKDYLPNRNQFRVDPDVRNVPQKDPFFQNIPAHLLATGKGRHLKIGGLTKEEKID
jgi:hypothetical protein